MADLINLTSPVAPRDYASNQQNNNNRQQNVQQNTSGQVFDLGTQNTVIKTNNRSEDHAERDLKDSGSALIRSGSDIVKNPSSALNTAKALLSRETLSLIRESGDGESLGKLTEFASEVMLTPKTLSGDMAAQQKESTIYGDELWKKLNMLSEMSGSKTFSDALAEFAKAAANLSAKDEILHSLAANFRYLASEAAPGKAVADELMAASRALSGADAAQNFAALKGTLIKLLGYTEKSLLLNDDTQNLLSLIVHSMSRYTDSPDALKGSFRTLLALTDGMELSEEQLNALGTGGKSISEMLSKLFDKYISGNDHFSPDAKQAAMLNGDFAKAEAAMRSNVNLLAAGARHMAERIPSDVLMKNLSSIDFTEGADALAKALGAVIPNTPAMRAALQSLFDELESTGNLDKMVDQLNTILENIGDKNAESMMHLAQGLNTALSEMAASGRYSCSAATSMEILADFMTKNINSSFLHSLSGLDQSDMIQNMLTAPGVFTPLIHQFVPLDAFGLKAFGELWVDPKADRELDGVGSKDGSENGSHMFLCFDIEDMGYFELEIYEKEKNLNIMLFCPEDTAGTFASIRKTIPQIAAANGYKVVSSTVDTVRSKRTLDQVFPKLNDQRSSLNVKI
ncbi:MAG: hypothetical protein ACI4Q6_05580 [Huintestinicola sp.]